MRGNPIINVLIFAAVLVGLFMLARGIFILLAWAAPVLVLLTVIINYRVPLNFIKSLIKLVKVRPLVGIVAILLTVVAFPVVALFLLGKALFVRRVDQLRREQEQQIEGEYIDYEEIREDRFELPEYEEEKPERDTDEYDALFRG
jgi:hypothetical protein